ncbi:zinc finger protein 99-like [Culicoides brevitarsis]|uniref:zinc finger protein 99-like n=1 Tax=Culicoides brevitarsis TaxID=469753 RepID=UPI00307B54EC
METEDGTIVVEIEEQTTDEPQDVETLETFSEWHQCPLCEEYFRISKSLLEHMILKHRSEKQWKLSEMLNIIESRETIYSSDSDCDYEISIEITKRPVSRAVFKENLRKMQKQTEPLRIIDSNERSDDDLSDETRVKCPKCDVTFTTRKILRSHIKLFHVEEMGIVDYELGGREKLECPECTRVLCDPRNLRKHVKLCHNKNIRFRDEKTGKWGKLLTFTAEKMKTLQNSSSSKDFPIVRGTDKDTGRIIFKCGLCGFGPFLCPRAIKRHQTKEHGREPLKVDTKDEIFRCDQCSKEFWNKDNLMRHMKLHSDAKNYVCNFCGNAYKTSAVLRKHRLAHVHIKCLLCGEEFYLKSDYKAHHKARHDNEEKSFESREPDIEPIQKRMPHIPKKVEDPVKCERCKRIFAAMCGYKVHKCVENEKNVCNVCGSKFRSKKRYQAHECPGVLGIKIVEDEEIEIEEEVL